LNKRTFNINFSDLDLGPDQIERVLGKTGDESREMVMDLIYEVLEDSARVCDIRAEYAIYKGVEFNSEIKSVAINDIQFNIGKIIWGQIRKSESVAVFLCTAGEEIGHLARKLLAEKDFLRGYIYDIAGSEIVEAAADIMQEKLREEAGALQMSITNRFSPGYCGWNVSEQHNLFRLLPENFCSISLTESALMIPIKSVSGIIGLGRDVRFRPYTCNLCDKENCIYRNVKQRHTGI
jgi:hypothetical protein